MESFQDDCESQHEMFTMARDGEKEAREAESLAQGSRLRKRQLPVDNTQSLNAKFAREAEKIIKLRVTSDAIHWQLKERVKDLEAIKDRQSQNLIKQQMQYETLDTKLRNELRLREDIINKVANTRSICAVVEQHAAAAISTLTRCEQDRQTLCDAYEKAALAINDIKIRSEQFQQRQKLIVKGVQDKYDAEVFLRKEMENNRKREMEQSKELTDQLRIQIDQANSLNTLLKGHNDSVADENNLIKSQLSQVNEELKNLTVDFSAYREKSINQISDLTSALKINDSESVLKNKQIETINIQFNELKNINQEIEKNKDVAEKRIEKTAQQLQSLETLCRQEALEKTELEYKYKMALELETKKIDEISMNHQETLIELKSIKINNEELNHQITNLTSELANQKQDNKNNLLALREQLNIVQEQLTSAREQLNLETKSVSHLEEEKKSLESNATSLSNTLTSLMSQLKTSTDLRARQEKITEQMRNEADAFKAMQLEKEKISEQQNRLIEEEFFTVKTLLKNKIDQFESLKDKNVSLQNELTTSLNKFEEMKKTAKTSVRSDIIKENKSSRFTIPAMKNTTKKEAVQKGGHNTEADPKIVLFNKKQLLQGEKPSEVDPFLSDSSFDGFVYNADLIKRQYHEMMYGVKPTTSTEASAKQQGAKSSKKKKKYSNLDKKSKNNMEDEKKDICFINNESIVKPSQ